MARPGRSGRCSRRRWRRLVRSMITTRSSVRSFSATCYQRRQGTRLCGRARSFWSNGSSNMPAELHGERWASVSDCVAHGSMQSDVQTSARMAAIGWKA